MIKKIKKIVRFFMIDLWIPDTGFILEKINSRLSQGDNFIQIGSNDGKSGDPIHEFIINKDLSGILIEPEINAFRQLKETYKNKKNVFFENSAIADKTGLKKFYYLRPNSDLPAWYSQLNSFSREFILSYKGKIKNIEHYLSDREVQCYSLSDIIKKYGFEKIDLLHIDTEGYDFTIIRNIDFKIKPRMILFEHSSIYADWKRNYGRFLDYMRCIKLLKKHGYVLFTEGRDTLAILQR